MIRACIDVDPEDAVAFTALLNDDGGFREVATHRLLMQNKRLGIERHTAFVTVLGNISRGFTEALERERLLDLRRRASEIKELAGIAA